MDPALANHGDESFDGTPFSEGSLRASPYSNSQQPSQQDSIPLVCSICPKNATFSDISHLLTHVSSKGHLHNYFQLSISRDTDEESALALAQYDSWFSGNGINALLRVRQTARAQRGTQQQQQRHGPNGAVEISAGRTSIQSGRGGRTGRSGRGNRNPGRRARGGSNLAQVKSEPIDDNFIDDLVPNGHPSYPWFPGAIGQQEFLPYPDMQSHRLDGLDIFDGEDDSSNYDNSESLSAFHSEDIAETVEDGTGLIALKGIIYPGMSGFDSATKEARKKRNQRKDPIVVRRLRSQSQKIQRTECVRNLQLDIERVRDVYDEPSIDGSMDEEEPSPEQNKRQKPKTRAANKSQPKPASRYRHRGTRGTRTNRTFGRQRQLSQNPHIQTGGLERSTRSSSNRQSQLPLHSHGLHTGIDIFHDPSTHDDEGSVSSLVRSRRRQNDRLPPLALRPGNPNLAFASSSGLKKSPAGLYPGKENSSLAIKSPASSTNPYLQGPSESMENSSYNPLYVQHRDGYEFRMNSIFDDDGKSDSASSFQPVNGQAAYNSLHISSHESTDYHRTQSGGDAFGI
ncbi:hypothetical protein F5Y15DRAFT_419700 [Xylariaceae sp. FL0016]|nr:hypothetical protein F5Y15DRAFT_419700 [Xylariaceae sp. FL0016]